MSEQKPRAPTVDEIVAAQEAYRCEVEHWRVVPYHGSLVRAVRDRFRVDEDVGEALFYLDCSSSESANEQIKLEGWRKALAVDRARRAAP